MARRSVAKATCPPTDGLVPWRARCRKLGGQIFGLDIDPNGNGGILSESTSLPGGKYLAAVEINLHAREGTPSMNIQSRVSFLTNNAEVRTIGATSARYSILPDRMTG